MGLAGALRTARVKLSGDTRRPVADVFWQPMDGARALEVGGPSACFGSGYPLPIYPVLASIDGVQPMAISTWHELAPEAGNVIDGQRRGELHITQDVDLGMFPDGTYDLVLSSHVIEHIANPLRSLAAWRRVTRPKGHLLLVVPHMQGTFDHRRPLTSLAHMIADFDQGTEEDDLSHLDEVLRLHDGSRDVRDQTDPEFVAELRDNLHTRLLHHHTFTTRSLVALLDYAGLQLSAVEPRLPHDIYAVGHWLSDGERPDNRRFAGPIGRSPFRIDRQARRHESLAP